MAVNRVIFGAETLLDITGDTVTPDDVAEGVTFHGADGVKRAGRGALKAVFLSMGLSISGQISYGTLAAGNIGFKPKFALLSPTSSQSGTLMDIENKRMYGSRGSSLDVIFPDGSAKMMGNSGWPSNGAAATPTYADYGGIQYAYVENDPGFRWYARSIWFHPDGSIRAFSRSAYTGADWTSVLAVVIG